VLELIDVHTYYGDTHVLNCISLEVKPGSVVALLGRNGMGKTTTIRTIIGFTPPREGIIRFQGTEIQDLQPHQIARLGIGLVPQGRIIFPSLSVEENLTLGYRPGEGVDRWTKERIYDLFPILKDRAKYKGNLLSGGEQQMLTIARALMTNPKLLLMDEPSEGLAPIIVKDISDIIQVLKQSGFSILLVEQNVPMALRLADYVYIISKGKIEHESEPAELKGDVEIKQRFLGV
jgi:branched-chain amino acid transport system ATP-binding protein